MSFHAARTAGVAADARRPASLDLGAQPREPVPQVGRHPLRRETPLGRIPQHGPGDVVAGDDDESALRPFEDIEGRIARRAARRAPLAGPHQPNPLRRAARRGPRSEKSRSQTLRTLRRHGAGGEQTGREQAAQSENKSNHKLPDYHYGQI